MVFVMSASLSGVVVEPSDQDALSLSVNVLGLSPKALLSLQFLVTGTLITSGVCLLVTVTVAVLFVSLALA